MAVRQSFGQQAVSGVSSTAGHYPVDQQPGAGTDPMSTQEVAGTEPMGTGDVEAHTVENAGRKLTWLGWRVSEDTLKTAASVAVGATATCALVATALAVPGKEPPGATAAFSLVAGLGGGVVGLLFKWACCSPDQA